MIIYKQNFGEIALFTLNMLLFIAKIFYLPYLILINVSLLIEHLDFYFERKP